MRLEIPPTQLPAFLTPPRLVLAFMALSLAAWLLPLWAAGAILAGSVAAGLRLGLAGRSQRGRLKVYALFILFWAVSAFGLHWLAGGLAWPDALGNAADLGLRLAAMAALTLNLGLLLTPFDLARVLARALRPILGEARANNAGLALAVMLRLMPQAGHCLAGLWQTRKLRARRLPLSRQLGLLATAALRHLMSLAWRQSLALAARDIHLAPSSRLTAGQAKE